MKRLKTLALAAMAVGVIGAVGAPAAGAAVGGSADVSCTGATFHYAGFGAGTHIVQETVYEDNAGVWDRLKQIEFTFQGDSGSDKVDLRLGAGTHTIRPDAWQLNSPNPADAHIPGFIPPPGTTLECDGVLPPPPPTGSATVTCDSVTFNYDGFGDGTHIVQESVYEDNGGLWDRLKQVEFTFEGDSASHAVDIRLDAGPHTIRPDAWQLNAPDGARPHIEGFIPPPGTNLECDGPSGPPPPSGSAHIDCDGATFSYEGFGAGTHVVQETVYEDTGEPLWNRLKQVEFTFQGDSATDTVGLRLDPGTYTIRPDAWQLDAPTADNPHIEGFIPPPGTTIVCEAPAPPTSATGSADINCDSVTFTYAGFGAGTHVVQETVYEDTGQPLWNQLEQVEFTFEGDSASDTVGIDPGSGTHKIRPDAWQLNSTGSANPHVDGFIPPPPTTINCDAPNPPATAPTGSADVSCDSVTFNYEGFGDGPHTVQETVYEDTGGSLWNRLAQVEFSFDGDSASDVVNITVGPGSHTIRTDAWQLNAPAGVHPQVDGFKPSPATKVDCGPPPPCTQYCTPTCPSGKVSMRWHYATPGRSGSWSATKSTTCPSTLTFARQAMEGDLKVSPGTAMQVGYSFKAPQGPITVAPKIDFTVRCADGSTPSKALWTITLPTQTYNVTSGDWWPTGDQHSTRSYQSGSVPVPDFCHKGKVRLDKGGVFTARFS